MLFILPDEGSSPADVLGNAEVLTSLLDWEELDKNTAQVEWVIPRFTMKKTLNLEDGLTALGLGELFDAFGNPLPLLSGDGTPAYIGKAEQGTLPLFWRMSTPGFLVFHPASAVSGHA